MKNETTGVKEVVFLSSLWEIMSKTGDNDPCHMTRDGNQRFGLNITCFIYGDNALVVLANPHFQSLPTSRRK